MYVARLDYPIPKSFHVVKPVYPPLLRPVLFHRCLGNHPVLVAISLK